MTAVAIVAEAALVAAITAEVSVGHLALAPGLSHETTVDRDPDHLPAEATETVMIAEIVDVTDVAVEMAAETAEETTRTVREVAVPVVEDAIEEIVVARTMKTAKAVLTSPRVVPTMATEVTTVETTTMVMVPTTAIEVTIASAIAAWIETIPLAMMEPDLCMMTVEMIIRLTTEVTPLPRSLKRLGPSQSQLNSQPRLLHLSQIPSRTHQRSPRIDLLICLLIHTLKETCLLYRTKRSLFTQTHGVLGFWGFGVLGGKKKS